MLIRQAELWGGSIADVRLEAGRIPAIGALPPKPDEPVLQAGGGLLLPGLHDHHLHLAASAAARSSVACGPPAVRTPEDLAAALDRPGGGWLRGIGYHESVAGLPDRTLLDELAPDRPVRIQHRSGRMWFLNSAALDRLLAAATPPPGLERVDARWTGRLFDSDIWLRTALAGSPPSLEAIGADLARAGVTGVTDMTPGNDATTIACFAEEQRAARLPQTVVIAGTAGLADAAFADRLALGPLKLHLHEAALPDLDATTAAIAAAHRRHRAVAIHCVSEVELVFALAAIAAAGPLPGDRIEHAGIAPDTLVAEIARLGLAVVSQPHFIVERGEQYLADVAEADHPLLYRLAAFARAGVTLAAGSDAPFGAIDPWAAMRAAVDRRTASGALVGANEALTPEQALALYLGDPLALGRQRTITVGAPADLCLLRLPWRAARSRLRAEDIRATWIAGERVHDDVDQPPA